VSRRLILEYASLNPAYLLSTIKPALSQDTNLSDKTQIFWFKNYSPIITMNLILVLAFALASHHAFGADNAWLGPDRNKWPDTEFRKTKNDFAGMLLVTPDLDWEKKWNTPPDTIPYFKEAKNVNIGEELRILTFFVNPKIDSNGDVNVVCGIKVTRPNGTVSADKKNIPCMKGKLLGDPNNIRLSPAVIHYVGEKSDPLGMWIVDVGIQDVNRQTLLQLRAYFNLRAKGS
jgi:hypothetical protein